MPHEFLVTYTRSGREESHHLGAYCVFRNGKAVRERGDTEVPVFYRSAAKPLQSLVVVESGAADRFGLTDPELALTVGSHAGSPLHARTAASILAKVGEGPEILRCGGHRSLDPRVHEDYIRRGYVPGRIEDNCSGKHAGMIAAAKALGADPKSYADRDHPVQRRNLAGVARFTGVAEDEIRIGVDGCAVPSFGVGVRAMARAAALFGTPEELPDATTEAVRRITRVVLAHPEMIAGDGLFDTQLIRAGKGKLLVKQGAEGVEIVSVVGERMGLAVKIGDGARRAVRALLTELLVELGLITRRDATELAPRVVRTREGDPIGEIQVRL